jgi:hypothetical protein
LGTSLEERRSVVFENMRCGRSGVKREAKEFVRFCEIVCDIIPDINLEYGLLHHLDKYDLALALSRGFCFLEVRRLLTSLEVEYGGGTVQGTESLGNSSGRA